jgi:hypothetical protein
MALPDPESPLRHLFRILTTEPTENTEDSSNEFLRISIFQISCFPSVLSVCSVVVINLTKGHPKEC